jgi:hypothetical protein
MRPRFDPCGTPPADTLAILKPQTQPLKAWFPYDYGRNGRKD